VSATPAVGTNPERGVQQHHQRASTPPSIALTGAYHGEERAIEKCTRKGKYTLKPRENDCQRSHGEGHEVTGPSAPFEGAPLQQAGLSRNEKSEQKSLRYSKSRGHEGHLVGQGRRFASRRGEGPDERAKTHRTRVITTKGHHPAGQGTRPPKSQHPTNTPKHQKV